MGHQPINISECTAACSAFMRARAKLAPWQVSRGDADARGILQEGAWFNVSYLVSM